MLVRIPQEESSCEMKKKLLMDDDGPRVSRVEAPTFVSRLTIKSHFTRAREFRFSGLAVLEKHTVQVFGAECGPELALQRERADNRQCDWLALKLQDPL